MGTASSCTNRRMRWQPASGRSLLRARWRRHVLLPTGAFGRYWAALVRIVLTEAGRALSHRVSGSMRVDDWRIVVCCMLSACCMLSMLRGPLG